MVARGPRLATTNALSFERERKDSNAGPSPGDRHGTDAHQSADVAAIFSRIEAGQPRGRQFADAGKAALAVLVILVLAALFGQRLLGLFGVSLDAFMVAGGSVLAWIGFGMLRGAPAGSQGPGGGAASEDRSLTPLILFAASPGTITGVITLAVAQTRQKFPVTALVAVFVGALVMWLAIALAVRFGEPVSRRERLCARHRHPFHGVDRDRDGSPVHAHGHSDVHENQRAVIAIVFSRPVSIGNHEPLLNETEGLTMGKLKTSSKKSETQPSTETSPSFGFHPSWAELYEMGNSLRTSARVPRMRLQNLRSPSAGGSLAR